MATHTNTNINNGHTEHLKLLTVGSPVGTQNSTLMIDKDKIILEAELFSLDGTVRFYEKKTSTLDKFKQLGIEVGKSLKTKSNNSYKR